jgi:hypothetical protein
VVHVLTFIWELGWNGNIQDDFTHAFCVLNGVAETAAGQSTSFSSFSILAQAYSLGSWIARVQN